MVALNVMLGTAGAAGFSFGLVRTRLAEHRRQEPEAAPEPLALGEDRVPADVDAVVAVEGPAAVEAVSGIAAVEPVAAVEAVAAVQAVAGIAAAEPVAAVEAVEEA